MNAANAVNGPCGPCGPWVKQLGGRLYVRDFGGEVIATVELTSSGGWHTYVSEPGCTWSWSETFTDLATARDAADTAAARWQLHASDEAGTVAPALTRGGAGGHGPTQPNPEG